MLGNWKFDFDLTYLPEKRLEYHDPTLKAKYSVPRLDKCFNAGHNIWLCKPSGFCRGRGIELFTDLTKLKEDLPNFYKGYNDWETLEITEEKKKHYAMVLGSLDAGRREQQPQGNQAQVDKPGYPEVPGTTSAAQRKKVRSAGLRSDHARNEGLHLRVRLQGDLAPTMPGCPPK